jgi:serine protease Do
MRAPILRAILLSAAVALATWLPAVPRAAAAGVEDPGLADMVTTLLPSVVNITTTRYKNIQIPSADAVIAQAAEPDKSLWYGSGFILSTDGYVLTNKHVVHNGINFQVTVSDGAQYPADLIGEAMCCDIAILKIRENRPFIPVKMGDSNALRQGDFVIAIGNPLGFNSTVTTGIVSALNRDFHFTQFDDYIQTDAAINEGNSGGPLFNAKGEVIGVNSALYTTSTSTGNIGIGLAIPIDDAKAIVSHMRNAAMMSMRPAYLGVQAQSLTPELARAYGLPGPWGSIVLKVLDGTPAAKAKLHAGDIITSVGNEFTADSRALLRDISETIPGTTVMLGILRDGTQQTLPVTLIAVPDYALYGTFLGEPGAPKPDLPPEAKINFGLRMAAVTPDLRAKFHLNEQQQGVVITGVAVGSAAANEKINAGSLIVQVRNAAVASPDDVVKAVGGEHNQMHPFVPMLIAEPSGLRWVSLPFD